MKKVLPYILFVSLFVYLIIGLLFSAKKWDEVLCKGIRISIENSEENTFIDELEVGQLIKRHFGEIEKKPIAQIDLDSVEQVLRRNAVIRSAEVYHSLDGYLYVNVKQRIPMLRIFSKQGYYVDEEGKMMPLSRKFTARVIVATGDISTAFACQQLFPFVKELRKDPFWEALVEQIVVTADEEVLLIPKVGNFRIRIGALEHVEQKMENLYLFLQEGIVLKGWNRYKEINLKYENQIVCVKR